MRHLLQQAVVKRTVADVPVGCFLSGGIDSGLVVALLSQTLATAVRTFSVGVEGEDNELPDARVLARRYATDHTEFLATPDLFGDLSFLITHMGEPFADSSLLPSFRLCQLMSGQLKVVLSGDGGDELFGGYPEYLRAFRTDQFLQRYPPWARWFAVVADKIWARLLRRRGENLGSCRDYARLAPHQRLYRHMGFSLAERHHLYTPGALQALAGQAEEVLDDLWREHALGGGVAGLMRTSLRSRLLNDYLVKIDRASMLNSLEVRSPFLDQALVEWAFRLPPRLCFGHGEQKWLLKNLAEKEVDSAIRSRPKRGFSIPLADWLRGPLRPQVLQLGEAGGALHHLGLFRGSSLREMVPQHLSGHSDHAHRLWALLILDLWLNQWRLGGTN